MLYPDDRTYQGKELRLKQQHFFVSATIQVSFLPRPFRMSACAGLATAAAYMTGAQVHLGMYRAVL